MVDEKEKEVNEKEMIEGLTTMMNAPDDKKFENLNHSVRFLAQLIYNLRYDLNELILGVLGEEDDEQQEEYIPTSEEDLEKIKAIVRRFDGIYS